MATLVLMEDNMVGFMDSRVFSESCWYVAEYDKDTGVWYRDSSITHDRAKELLQAIGANEYQDVYSLAEDGLKVLHLCGCAIDDKTKVYQLEICRD